MTEELDRMRAPAWGAAPATRILVPFGDGIPIPDSFKGDMSGVSEDDIEVGPYGTSYVYRMRGHLSKALYHNVASARAASRKPQHVTDGGLVAIEGPLSEVVGA